MTKTEEYKHLLETQSLILSCPLCAKRNKVDDSSLNLVNNSQLVCKRLQHTFDIASKGYVNFNLSGKNTHYPKLLFEARNMVNRAGLFTPLYEKIAYCIMDANETDDTLKILDAGCGEGSGLIAITDKVKTAHGFGVDISSEGISLAARQSRQLTDNRVLWFSGDLAILPFSRESMDCVLNIMSPANYNEFKRVLKKSGILIKVLPQEGYLQELRNFLYHDTDKNGYTNEKTGMHFENSFNIIGKHEMSYKFAVPDKQFLKNLVTMTPLSAHSGEDACTLFSESGVNEITVAFTILIGSAMPI